MFFRNMILVWWSRHCWITSIFTVKKINEFSQPSNTKTVPHSTWLPGVNHSVHSGLWSLNFTSLEIPIGQKMAKHFRKQLWYVDNRQKLTSAWIVSFIRVLLIFTIDPLFSTINCSEFFTSDFDWQRMLGKVESLYF
jgi:hypothetical protein